CAKKEGNDGLACKASWLKLKRAQAPGSESQSDSYAPDCPESVLSTFCQNCRWIIKNEHPQAIISLSAEATSKSGKIPVEKARSIGEELTKTSPYIRVVVIADADQDSFHRPAANALLKTIEEPRTASIFLLFADAVELVLPTVVSRTQVIPFRNSQE